MDQEHLRPRFPLQASRVLGGGEGCWQGPGGLTGRESVFVLGESVSAINPCTMDAMLPGVYDLFGDLVLFQIGDWLKKHLRRRTKQKRPLNLLTYYYYFVI